MSEDTLVADPKPRFAPWLFGPMLANKSTYTKVAMAAVLMLVAARPALRARLERGAADHAPLPTNARVGRGAVVLSRVDAHGGRVRIGGDEWSARTLDAHDVIEEGTAVTVMRISGATAVVVAAG